MSSLQVDSAQNEDFTTPKKGSYHDDVPATSFSVGKSIRKSIRRTFSRRKKSSGKSRDEAHKEDVEGPINSPSKTPTHTPHPRDTVLIKVKAGECFSNFTSLVVTPIEKCDPHLGTLGELRHELQTGTSSQIKKFLRSNDWKMQHRVRSELWKELCKRGGKSLDPHISIYNETIERLPATGNLRPFFLDGPGVIKCDHLLNEEGKAAVQKVLAVVEHVRPDFTNVPILYPLAVAMLHYMKEEEAYACLIVLLEQNQKYLIQTEIAYSASKRTLFALVKKHLAKTNETLKKGLSKEEKECLIAIFNDWHGWIFRDLPFSHLVRVIDCFMYEGQKVLYRVALGILHLWRKDTHKMIKGREDLTPQIVSEEIGEFCKSIPCSPEKLLKTSFGIRNLKMSQIRLLQERHELEEKTSDTKKQSSVEGGVQKQQRSSIHAPPVSDILLKSNIISGRQVSRVGQWIPARIQLLSPVRMFSLREEGTSFTRLWQKIEEAEQTLFLFLSSNDEIFGAYCSCDWTVRKSGKAGFFGTGETFLFRIHPGPAEKYGWVGMDGRPVEHSQELFTTATQDSLTIGGGGSGQGISIREELVKGETRRCETFANDPLVPSESFEIKDLEVFGFGVIVEE